MFGQDFMELKVSEMIKFIGSTEKIVETPNGNCNYKHRDEMDDMMIFFDKIQTDPQVVPQLEDCNNGDYPQEVVAESFHHSSKIVNQSESMKAAEFIVPDEHSEAGYDYHRPLRKRYESYICSSSDDEESSNAFTREVPSKTSKGSKRKRIAEASPYLSNKRQRAKINQKMRMLQKLIPNCGKVDKASVLDKAIEYLKNLQFQLQVMSIGMRPYMIASTLSMHGNANPPMAAPMGLMSQGYYNIPVNPVAVPLITTFNPPLSSLVPRLVSPTASPVFPSPIGFVPPRVREYGVGFDGRLSFV